MKTRRSFLKSLVKAATLTALPIVAQARKKLRPNILFIAIDDLRPQLGCYGNSTMVTPNMDTLAAAGTLFERAYCQIAVCGASRASLMSGLRPTPARFKTYLDRVTEQAPGVTTLPMYLRQSGYHTISNGKIYHHRDDDIHAWSEEPWFVGAALGGEHKWLRPENINIHQANQKRYEETGERKNSRGPAFEWADAPDDLYPDDAVTTKSIEDLQRLKKMDKPFFLGVGYVRPHLPFNAPKRFWDMYDRDRIKIPDNYFTPKGAPDVALHNFGELRSYHDIPHTGAVSDETARNLIHGYYACVSFVDYEIGRLLKALDDLELRDNTIIILWGDHGWQLGEHAMWCKHCNFETSTHVPMLISAPGFKANNRTDALVEFVDIYPSLAELAGLPTPDHCQGTSFAPLMRNADLPWKSAAFSRWNHGWSIRTDRYRYTEWRTNGTVTDRMLYDHQTDADENVNISEHADNAVLVERLSIMLNRGWKSCQ